MAGPIKRSMMIAGHATSISLEPVFWTALREAAEAESVPLNALVARIDAARVEEAEASNLGSAIRVWLFERARGDLRFGGKASDGCSENSVGRFKEAR